MRTVLIPFVVLSAGFLGGCKGSGTPLILPSPGPETYAGLEPLAVSAVSNAEAVVVGRLMRQDGATEGLILITRSFGRSWKRVGFEAHDLTHVQFEAVHFQDRLRGFAGGLERRPDGSTAAFVFRTSDGGNHWYREPLVMDPNVRKTSIHSLTFTDDSTGLVRVRYDNPAGGDALEDAFATVDSGRTWTVLGEGFRVPSAPPTIDPKLCFDAPGSATGWRLVPGTAPGFTLVEQTASAGASWMPVAELSAAAMASYYGSADSPRP